MLPVRDGREFETREHLGAVPCHIDGLGIDASLAKRRESTGLKSASNESKLPEPEVLDVAAVKLDSGRVRRVVVDRLGFVERVVFALVTNLRETFPSRCFPVGAVGGCEKDKLTVGDQGVVGLTL